MTLEFGSKVFNKDKEVIVIDVYGLPVSALKRVVVVNKSCQMYITDYANLV